MSTEKKRIENIEKVLSATKKYFIKYGVYNTRQVDIAKEVGITPRSIQNYFDSKEELIAATIIEIMKKKVYKVKICAKNQEKSQKSGYEQLEEYFIAEKNHLLHKYEESALMAELEVYMVRNMKAAVETDVFTEYCLILKQIIIRGIEDGSIKADLDRETLVHMIAMFLWGGKERSALTLLNKKGRSLKNAILLEENSFQMYVDVILSYVKN